MVFINNFYTCCKIISLVIISIHPFLMGKDNISSFIYIISYIFIAKFYSKTCVL